MTISKILVAADFSEDSARALDFAIELSRDTGASIDIVHAFVSPVPAVYRQDVALPEDFELDARKAAKKMLEAEADKVRAANMPVRTHLTDIPAAAAITRTAEEIDADLLVLGTRGHSGLKHILMGSVAEHCVRLSPCSVLVVK